MNTFFTHFIWSHALLAICYLLYRTLISRQSWFQLNRFVLVLLPLLAICSPYLRLPLLDNSVQTMFSGVLPEVILGSPPNSSPLPEWQTAMVYLYAGISAVLIISMLFRLAPLMRVSDGVKEDGYSIANSDGGSYSFFHQIFLDPALQGDERKMVLRHEQVHADQWHSVDVIWYTFAAALFWCNPAIWLLRREVRENHEFIADRAIGQEFNQNKYLNTLLNASFQTHTVEFIPMFNHSKTLIKRVKMMKMKNLKPNPLRYFSALTLLAVVILAAACSNAPQDLAPQSGGLEEPTTGQQDKALKVAEQMPTFPGGQEELIAYLMNNIEYPEAAKSAGVNGRVLVQFVVNTDGSIGDVDVIKGIGNGCDEEARRVVAAMPSWSPGVQDGKAVRVQYTLPIQFALES